MKRKRLRRGVATISALSVLSVAIISATGGPASAETRCLLHSWTKGSLMWDQIIIQTGLEEQINGYFHSAGPGGGCWGSGLYNLNVDTTHTRCYYNPQVAPIVLRNESCTYGIDKSYWYTKNGTKRYYWARWSITFRADWTNGDTGHAGTFEMNAWFKVHESGELTWDATWRNVSGDLSPKDFRKANGGLFLGNGL